MAQGTAMGACGRSPAGLTGMHPFPRFTFLSVRPALLTSAELYRLRILCHHLILNCGEGRAFPHPPTVVVNSTFSNQNIMSALLRTQAGLPLLCPLLLASSFVELSGSLFYI